MEFYVSSINTREAEVPCVVLLEDAIVTGKEKQELRTPCRITLQFKPKRGGSYEGVKLGVKAVQVDAEGKIIHGLRKGEASEYHEEWRQIKPTDATRQLFVLYRKRAGN